MDHPWNTALPWGLHPTFQQLKRVPVPRKVCFPSVCQSWGCSSPNLRVAHLLHPFLLFSEGGP